MANLFQPDSFYKTCKYGRTNHPAAYPGEEWVFNVFKLDLTGRLENLYIMYGRNYPLRLGQPAYNTTGEILPDMYAVFARVDGSEPDC